MSTNQKANRRQKIKRRISAKVRGTSERPRLLVFRSNKEIYAQIIDDSKQVTICAASSKEADIASVSEPKVSKSSLVGKRIAEKAISTGIKSVVFDRNGYLYHGRVKSLAEGAREGGLEF